MKLYYVTSARLSHEQAHGIQIVKMCEAFARAGADVTLVAPRIGAHTDIFAAYGVEQNFTVKYIPALYLPLWLPGAFGLMALTFALGARAWLAMQSGQALIYTRGEMPLFMAPLLPRRFSLAWETHIKPERPGRYAAAVRRANLVVAITKYYADEIPKVWGISKSKVLYTPDAVDIKDFAKTESKDAARTRLGLPHDKKIVLYAGRIDSWKGAGILLEASNLLPSDTLVAIVGGTDAQIAELTPNYPKVVFLGYRPYKELPGNQAAADVLVLTGDPSSAIAQHYTSPLKLFTYMASGVPTLAFDLPAYRDILSGQNAFFCAPNPVALAETLQHMFTNPTDMQARAQAALAEVQQYTWEARAKKILAAL